MRSSSRSAQSSGTSGLLQAYLDKVQQHAVTAKSRKAGGGSSNSSSSNTGSSPGRTRSGGSQARTRRASEEASGESLSGRLADSGATNGQDVKSVPSAKRGRGRPKSTRGRKRRGNNSSPREEACDDGVSIPPAKRIHRSGSPASPLRLGTDSTPQDQLPSSELEEVLREKVEIAEAARAKDASEEASFISPPVSPGLPASGGGGGRGGGESADKTKMFVCPDCGAEYGTKAGLKYHTLTRHALMLLKVSYCVCTYVCVCVWLLLEKRRVLHTVKLLV